MSSCSLMSSTWSLIPITHQCNVSQMSVQLCITLWFVSLPQLNVCIMQCAMCSVLCEVCYVQSLQCNGVCKVWGGRWAVCGVGSISHFLPRMETRGRTHQQMGSAQHCTASNCNTAGARRVSCRAQVSQQADFDHRSSPFHFHHSKVFFPAHPNLSMI